MQLASRITTLLALVLFSLPVQAGEILDAGEVRQLFNDKTVEYHHQLLGFDFVAYHAPDGSLRGTREGEPMTRMQWSVNRQGELCIAYHQRNRCHPIMDDNGVYKKYQVGKDGKPKVLAVYRRFLEGNPNGF